MQKENNRSLIYEATRSVMFGHAVGDALGVPVEFSSREELKRNPVTGMRGFGTYPVPEGCWSDDTSMALATLDSLKKGSIDYRDIMYNFAHWYTDGEYTPTGELFDIGVTCMSSISDFISDEEMNPLDCGLSDENSNGNGSLMRIHPIVPFLYYHGVNIKDAISVIHNLSSLTHRHKRSLIGCGIYTFVLWEILEDRILPLDKSSIISGLNKAMRFYADEEEFSHYKNRLARLIELAKGDTEAVRIEEIRSTGYVVDSLEAALYCLLSTDSYKECVLKAVNLGEDTDTVGAIAGGLAGALYGFDAIPTEWCSKIKKSEYIDCLCREATTKLWEFICTINNYLGI